MVYRIEITKEELMKYLETYFALEVEACPLNAEAFCDVLLCRFQIDGDNKVELF